MILTAGGLAVTMANSKLCKAGKTYGRGVLIGFRRRATPLPLPPPAAGTGTGAGTSGTHVEYADAPATDSAHDQRAREAAVAAEYQVWTATRVQTLRAPRGARASRRPPRAR